MRATQLVFFYAKQSSAISNTHEKAAGLTLVIALDQFLLVVSRRGFHRREITVPFSGWKKPSRLPARATEARSTNARDSRAGETSCRD
jgi:hypothetical protein